MPHLEHVRHEAMRIPVEIRGSASEPLLFLPGMGVHPRHYRAGLQRLARHYTVIAPDLSFGSHPCLPSEYGGYLACVETVAEHFAPEAPRVGHSLGGLLALQGERPAVALSPLIPLPLGWWRQFWRAVRLQLREFVGTEGFRGVRWAMAMLTNYAGMVLTAPEKLFPALSETHSPVTTDFHPRAPSVRLVLGRFDQLYRQTEYGQFVARTGLPPDAVRWLPHGHDWPVTRPDVMEAEVVAALRGNEAIDAAGRRLSSGTATG